MRRVGAALVLACLAPFFAIAATPGEPAAITRAEQRGVAMSWLDRAAWVSTDDMVARLPLGRGEEIGGWIITPVGRAYHADYIGKGDRSDRIVYSADVEGRAVSNAVVYPTDAEPTLTGTALAMERALVAARAEMARHTDWRPCEARPFNTIILPPEADGTMSVYFLTPQVVTGTFPFGGHYEVDVAADGHIVSARPFTHACLPMTPASTGADKVKALMVTHLLDRVPTEVHVFEQFGTGVPLYVGIVEPSSVWKVDDGKITRVEGAISP